MSIEPEVPYNYRDEDSSDDDNGDWRDPNILHANHAPFKPQPQFNNDTYYNNVFHQQPQQPLGSYTDKTTTSDTGHRNPDSYWILPVHCDPHKILGVKYKSRSNEIQKATGSFIEFNEKMNQVDIWGDTDAVNKTKAYLDMIVSRLAEKDTSLLRKTAKWSRPERELTPKEKRRAEKRQARLDEEKRYQGLPTITQNYHAIFQLPNEKLPIVKLLGVNEVYLNQMRADCKAYLWYDPQCNCIRISADKEESVKQAATRIRNWYIRICRQPQGGVIRLMEQPKKNCLLTFQKLPTGFVTYSYTDTERETIMLDRHRLLDTVGTGVMLSVNDIRGNDLINLEDQQQEQQENPADQLSDLVNTLNERNKMFIDQLLSRGLESLRLNDWNIRLKIRFGQICLIDYPKKEGQFLSIDKVSDKIFREPRFKSALAPCISKSKSGLNMLFDYLTTAPDAVEFSDNPRTEFTITAQQYPTAAPPPSLLRNRGPKPERGEMWNTIMKISFTNDGHRRLWNTMTDCKDLVDISCADIESHYSWDLKLQHARQLPNNDTNSPHEKFSYSLKINNEEENHRLIMVTSNDYIPQLVTQKTKWLYMWHDYVVEICKDEIWDINRVERTDRELPVDLAPIEPHRTLFKVSLYKEAWVNRLAENLDLKIGEAPTWTLRDFFAYQDENTHTLMATIKKFSDILNAEVPLYWDYAAEPSLV